MGSVSRTMSVAHGTLTVPSSGGASATGSGTGTVTLSGTISKINTTLSALNNVVYKGVQDINGSDTLSMPTIYCCYGDPRELHSFPTRRSSDLNAVNDAPVNAVPGAQAVDED